MGIRHYYHTNAKVTKKIVLPDVDLRDLFPGLDVRWTKGARSLNLDAVARSQAQGETIHSHILNSFVHLILDAYRHTHPRDKLTGHAVALIETGRLVPGSAADGFDTLWKHGNAEAPQLVG